MADITAVRIEAKSHISYSATSPILHMLVRTTHAYEQAHARACTKAHTPHMYVFTHACTCTRTDACIHGNVTGPWMPRPTLQLAASAGRSLAQYEATASAWLQHAARSAGSGANA